MRGGGGRHRFTLIGRKLVGKPAKMNYMNIHEGGNCLASVGLACLVSIGLACLVSIACSRDARQRYTE